MKSLKFFAFILGIHLTEVILFAGIWSVMGWQARVELAQKLGIGQEAGSLEQYVASHFLAGMSRRDVIESADRVGPYNVKPFYMSDQYCETLTFTAGPLGTPLGGRWVICYNKNDVTTSVTSGEHQ